jgi:hypothetical protein
VAGEKSLQSGNNEYAREIDVLTALSLNQALKTRIDVNLQIDNEMRFTANLMAH